MKRSDIKVCLVAVISLLVGAIWHVPASAAVAPLFQSLGEIREGLSAPGRIDVDAAGNIYVTDARKQSIAKFDKYGKVAGNFPAPVTGGGVAVTPDGSRIYVSGPDVVTILDGVTGVVLGQLGSGAGEFGRPGEIDLDAGGRIFVADVRTLFIKVYDPAGAFQYQFGGYGTVLGTFQTIWAMSINEAAGEVYVADSSAYGKVQVFDLAGAVKRSLSGTSSIIFGTPTMTFFGGMAFDQFGRGYFPDTFRSQIRIVGLPSTFLSSYNSTGYGLGQVLGPIDSVYDPETKRLFVVCDGARIEIFGIDGGQNPANANVKPGLPVPLSPVDDSEVASLSPTLLFQNAIDPDADDTLTYQVKVYGGEAVVADYANMPEGAGTTAVAIATELVENGHYSWAAQASDGEDLSGWTANYSFYVNAIQEAPEAPVLTAPEVGAMLAGDGVLSWQASADPDPFDTVSYVVEISADPSFAAPVVQQGVASTALSLQSLADYAALEDGTTYFWRVKAVDSHEMPSVPSAMGDFVYDTTVLAVTANMPGAKVYLGGNHAYAGRYVGEAPVALRDIPAGPCSVVVERVGFETYVAQVNPAYRENVAVRAELVPAIAPADFKSRALQAGGVDISVSGDSVPFVVDFNNDGLVDLLVGDANGALTLYEGMETAEGLFYYPAGVTLGLPLLPGAAPFVVDWDNDGRKDLVLGMADGSVRLCLNTGSEDAPGFGGVSFLSVAGVPINVGTSAVPVVADYDDDGDKDLIVGSASGTVAVFRNDGTDSAVQLVSAGNLVVLSGTVAPFFTDWDADGVKELLLSANEHIYVYKQLNLPENKAYTAVSVITVGSELTGKNGKSSTGTYSLGDRLRVFALDFDGKKGKDLIIGNSAGEVRLVHSNGSELVASFTGAMLDKVSSIDQMVSESAPETLVQLTAFSSTAEISALLAEISAAIEAQDFKRARQKITDLQALLPVGTEIAQEVDELAIFLQ